MNKNLTVTAGAGLEKSVIEFEKWFVWWHLERNSFNQSRTAKDLKTNRNNLVRRIHEWGWTDKVKDAYAGKSSDGEQLGEVPSERAVAAGHGPINGATL